MRISVIGTGYLGAVHAACMAELGHEVLGVDTDARKIAALAEGRAPFFEPGLSGNTGQHGRSGKLRFSTSLAEAAEFAERALHLCRHAAASRLARRRPQPHRSRDRRARAEPDP